MAQNKYYWLKLKRDFFKRHDIRIIEEMPNGKDYILFYLKLLLESIDHEGSLRFSDTIPYNESMLSVVTNTNIDIVRSAMKLFLELGMMSICDDKTIYMTEVEKMIGSAADNDNATRQRRFRERQKHLALGSVTENNATVTDCVTKNNATVTDCVTKNNATVTDCVTKNNESKSKRIDKETELEVEVVGIATTTTAKTVENSVENSDDNRFKVLNGIGKGVVYLTDTQMEDLLEKLDIETFDRYIERLADFIINKKAHVKSHYNTILKWVAEDSKVGG